MRRGADSLYGPPVAHSYPPLNLEVRTPRLVLAGATDELLERLIPVVRAGVVSSGPLPFDDPMSFYQDSPAREWQWLRGIWAGRAHVDRSWWRLYFVVIIDGEPAGMQDLIGAEFATFATVSTFSWLGPGYRGRGRDAAQLAISPVGLPALSRDACHRGQSERWAVAGV